ncbi:hypothetical protein [Marivirga sp.]|uniref:hypothetical protein n=1 Tax=Marivirga sp. TaxID=2018662 RepID=UPI0025FB1423|nr:hypothetical protein [Marivirga sp.]
MNYKSLSYGSSMDFDSINYHIGEANNMLNTIRGEGRFVDYLSLGQSFQLPVGIQKSIGGLNYTVIFHEIELIRDSAYIDAYLVIELPSENTLTFMGRDIQFTAEGGINGVGRVELIGNNNISFSENNEEQKILLTLLGGDPENPGNTYAEFDCYGFRELSIHAGVTFSKDILVKENPDGSISDDRVTAEFVTRVTDWNDIIVDISLPKFQMTDLQGWTFEVSNAVFDFSDSQNASSLTFPAGYESPYFTEGNRSLWRGFYFRQLEVTLPEEFNKKNQTARTSFFASNLIIDELGVTGLIGVRNIIGLNEGNADTWKLSVEEINVEILKNEFISGNIGGQIEVPSLETEDPLLYTGTFTKNGNYNLIARLKSTAKFNAFKADLNLSPNSLIELKVIEGKFKPRAVLHGNMDVNPTTSSDKKGAEVNGLIFQSLVLQTEAPYIDAQYFGFEQNSKENTAGGFSIGIEKIALQTDPENNRIGIHTNMVVNLVSAADNGFGAEAAFTIWAKRNNLENQIRYEYDELELSGIGIKVSRNGFSFNGNLQFYEGDNTYGNGFKGNVVANFGSGDKAVEVTATALFGSVDGFRYWYVDALAQWEKGFPIVSPFSLNGLGGGAFYHMRQQGLNDQIGVDLSKSNSGIVYIPDETVHLGIKASVIFSLQNAETAANGKAEFGISFNSNGGVNQISFNGSVEMMTQSFMSDLGKVTELASKVSNQQKIKSEAGSAFRGDVRLLFDNRNKSFHGIIDVYVNAAGGAVTGSNPGFLAGRSIIHFENNYWYIHIGKPSNPIGIQILGLAKTNSYFMIGHDIPGIPPPPQLVLDILTSEQRARNEEIRNSSRSLTELSSGKGFAFGTNFTIDTGEKRHLVIFYGRFAATAGFDINMTRYNASCSGQAGLVGINGWYAQGQAYVGLLATVGMDVNLRFLKKKVEIFHGELAALMQVKGPNPFWMRGDASGRFSVLDGLVEGDFDFDVEIGEECKLESSGESPLQEMKVIAELTPNNESQEIDVFTTPQAVFNIPVEKEFEILDFERNPMAYRVKLDYFKLKEGNKSLGADITYNSDKNVFVLDPKRVLPSTTDLELDIKIHFEERVNGTWVEFKENNEVVTETLNYSFTTGLQPDYIPEEMVEYSYPVEGMVNFYQGESDYGYIKLNDPGLTRPFEKEGRWDLKASFTDRNGNSIRTDFTYNDNSHEVRFNIPELPNNIIHHFQLLRVPSQENVSYDSNVEKVKNTISKTDDGKDINLEIQTMEAEGSIEALSEEEIYSFYIRTSKYNSLEQKLFSDDYNTLSGSRKVLRDGVHQLSIDITGGKEQFDKYEIAGGTNFEPLIYIEADFENTVWFENHLGPLLYDNYPYFPTGSVTNSESLTYGVPPVTAFYISQRDTDLKLNQSNQFGQTFFSTAEYFAIKYFSPDYVEKQYAELRNKASSYYRNRTRTERIERLLSSRFPLIRKGLYPAQFKYILPGGNEGRSDFQLSFYSSVGSEE